MKGSGFRDSGLGGRGGGGAEGRAASYAEAGRAGYVKRERVSDVESGGGGGYLVLVYQEPRAIQSPLLLLPKLC